MESSAAPEVARPFSNTEALRYGWKLTLANLTLLITLSAIGAVLAMLGRAIAGPERGMLVIPFLGPGIQALQVVLAFLAAVDAFRRLQERAASIAHRRHEHPGEPAALAAG